MGLILSPPRPLDPTEARKIKKNSSKFTMIDGELYRFGFTHPLLECVHREKCTRIMAELHEGICGSHVGGRALAASYLDTTAGYGREAIGGHRAGRRYTR